MLIFSPAHPRRMQLQALAQRVFPALVVAAILLFSAQVFGQQAGTSTTPAKQAPQTAANPGAPAGAIAQLRAFVAGIRSASGRFEQLADGAKPDAASRGRFVFARPGKFRWEVTDPYPQLLVADGSEVFFHDPDLNQVTIRKMEGALGATPAAILFGSGELDENFELLELPMADGVNWLQATPRVREAGFELIQIGFKDNVPVAMDVLDAFNRTTRFTFADLVRNPAVVANTFTFQIPEGADVVRQ